MSGQAALVAADDAYDRRASDDGVSRYGHYLRERAGQFVEGGEPVDADWFAVLAWKIASSPVMSPGYVEVRSDLGRVALRRAGDEPGLLVAEVEVPVDWPRGLRQRLGPAGEGGLAGQWRSWDVERDWSSGQQLRFPPGDARRPAVLLTACARVPIRTSELPARRRRELDTEDAKRTVRAVCARVNEAAGPAVAALREVL